MDRIPETVNVLRFEAKKPASFMRKEAQSKTVQQIRLENEIPSITHRIDRLTWDDVKEFDGQKYVRYTVAERLEKIKAEAHTIIRTIEDIEARV